MALRFHHSWACVAAGCVVGLVARPAFCEPSDAAALKLRNQAIYTDYLATNFPEAAGKLRKALVLCNAPTECSSAVRARLLCDLGVIDFVMLHATDGRAHFAAALKEDPTIDLERDLANVELQKEFAASKGGGAAPTTPTDRASAPSAARGDMAHTPVTSQAVLTPLPIYVELPDGVDAAKVYVRYRAPGATEWKTARMTRMGGGFGTEIPCSEVGESVGELKYFVQAVDGAGDLVASTGRLAEPYRVGVVAHLDGDPPHLPDKPPPSACASTTDCPPEFPGCHSTAKAPACVSDDECRQGQACTEGACTGTPTPEATERAPFKKNWLSVGFQGDALLMPSANNACAGGTGYTCFGSDGTYYAATPLSGADDQVNGGLTLATSRIVFGYDRAIRENVTLGARVGYALGGGPQRPTAASFLPVHVEARAAYWFGDNPLSRTGFRFFVLAAGGMAQVDASVPVDVYANLQAYQNSQSQDYRAWKKTGLAFAALGGGTMFALTPSTGIALEAKAMEMFPTAATGFSVQLAYLVGL